MADKFLWGCVNSNGSVEAGSGFKVDADGGTGIYTILFDTAFSSRPAVVTTQRFGGSGWNNITNHGADTRDNTVLIAVTNDRFRVKTGNSLGQGEDRDFTFIVTGPA